MSEDKSGAGFDGLPPRAAAAAIALGAAGQDPAIAGDAAAYLRKQVELAELQIEDMRREDSLRHWSVVVHHISDVLRMAFELALAVILIGFVAAVGSAVWVAAHDDSLVIEAFSVPPDLAQRGLTGQAIASQLQDKLSEMQSRTDSSRPAKSYSSNWGDGIKVMIPNTGISVGDVYRTLAGWLGSQTHITGEVYRTKDGIAITSRANGEGGSTVTGSETDFDALLQKSAEAIYHHTQPYRYAVYLSGTKRGRVALQHYRSLAESGTREDRLWAHMGLSSMYELIKPYAAPDENRKALAVDPNFVLARYNIANEEQGFSHLEQALAGTRKTIELMKDHAGQLSARAGVMVLENARGNVAFFAGDCQTAMEHYRIASGLPDYSGGVEFARMQIADCLAMLHRPTASRKAWADFPVPNSRSFAGFYYPQVRIESDATRKDWAGVLADLASAEAAYKSAWVDTPRIRPGFDVSLDRLIRPYAALAMAETGDLAGGEALIAKSALDCDLCVRMRGRIATLRHDWNAAAYWYAMVSKRTPSIPIADTEWGQMLMDKGDLDAAIAKFESAHKKGPHFADPLEMWGEALIAKNRSDLALAKFEEADKYAPNWGRLRLKWGEALYWSGQKADAQKQFTAAAKLYLTPAEQAQLSQMKAFHG